MPGAVGKGRNNDLIPCEHGAMTSACCQKCKNCAYPTWVLYTIFILNVCEGEQCDMRRKVNIWKLWKTGDNRQKLERTIFPRYGLGFFFAYGTPDHQKHFQQCRINSTFWKVMWILPQKIITIIAALEAIFVAENPNLHFLIMTSFIKFHILCSRLEALSHFGKMGEYCLWVLPPYILDTSSYLINI